MTTDHMKIAIKSWSKARAREMAEKAIKVTNGTGDICEGNMEWFLTELLTDALLTFNGTVYARHCTECGSRWKIYQKPVHKLDCSEGNS